MRLLFLLPLPLLVSASLNVTVDDTDPSIVYRGSWEPSSTHLSGLDYGGSHTVSSDAAANATFIFTGVAVYYLAPRWPYAVNTQLSLDGGPAIIVNLTDPDASTTAAGGSESAQSRVVWSATALPNTTHALFLTMARAGEFIVADGFIYTVDSGTSAYAAPGSASATLAAASGVASAVTVSPAHRDTLAIVLGTGVGIAVLLAALIAFYFFFYRRRRNTRRRGTKPLAFDADDGTTVTPFVVGSRRGAGADASAHPLLTPFDAHTAPYQDAAPTSLALARGASITTRTSAIGSEKAGERAWPGYGYSRSSFGWSVEDETDVDARVAAAPGSGRGEKSDPMREAVYTPAPPAYSEN